MAGRLYDEESLSDRQSDELQLLEAVYMDDFKDLRHADVWKVQRPPEIQLCLKPQQSISENDDIHVQIELHVKCPKRYPEVVPEIHLENPKGLSTQLVSKLMSDLKELSDEHIGEVMILLLAQHVQEFLHDHNDPPTKSFFDEMMSNKKQREEKEIKQQQRKIELLKKREEKERLEIEIEIKKREEQLKEEIKRRKDKGKLENAELVPMTPVHVHGRVTPIPMDSEQRSLASFSPSRYSTGNSDIVGNHQRVLRKRHTSTPRWRTYSSDDSVDATECSHHCGTSILAFSSKGDRTIHRGKCLGHSLKGSTVYAGMDTKTGELVSVSEWVIKWSHINRKLDLEEKDRLDQETTKYMKQISSIEQELLSLLRLHHHNLVHYLAINYKQGKGNITVNVLMEYVGGGSLESAIKNKTPIPIHLLRHYIVEILEGLAYLHNKAVVHKDIRPSSIFLDHQGRIRLSDFSIDKRLSDLHQLADSERPGVHFTDKASSPTIGRGGKKGDVYRLGITFLSLAEGRILTDLVPEISSTHPPDFQDFLAKCLNKDERQRWSVLQLLDHDFMKIPLGAVVHGADKNTGQMSDIGKGLKNEDDADNGVDLHMIASVDHSGQSRLKNEFELLKWLGKGGFGDVLKVKNKLDDRIYAIKRIPLNSRSHQFNRKITREVKLLSRLSHENVVRYYNSWIETSDDPVPSYSSESVTSTTSTDPSQKLLMEFNMKNSLGFPDDIEKLAPSVMEGSLEWSVSGFNQTDVIEDDSSSEDEDEDVFGASFMPLGNDSIDENQIVFEGASSPDDGDASEEYRNSQLKNSVNTVVDIVPKLQFLYIQMEFCEKSTLRNCIDAGLCEDMDRVWRLFREIIEGLVHIHEKGMIHRDLKPVNIFLDSDDHVKIGDFGLATTDVLINQTSIMDVTMTTSIHVDGSSGSGTADGNLTGKVGTALYVSPEMMTTGKKTHYSQKVDIYSLGIIFFEMCYPQLPTGMERVHIIGNLRRSDVIFPESFDEYELQNQSSVMRWLLNHDPSARPTSRELLQSEFIPTPQMEEAELNEVLRSTITNPHSIAFKRMMSTLFSQQISPAFDFIYDRDMYKEFSYKIAMAQRFAVERVEAIFQKHGGIKITMPTLMPKAKFYKQIESYVCLMDSNGGLVSLPYDLRMPFARYVARTSVTFLKRYSIGSVYRERKLLGTHPKEMTECDFDIVTANSGSLVADAEVIRIVYEIICEFPLLQTKGYYIRMNHISLLKAIFIHCKIPEEKHGDVFAVLSDAKEQRKPQIQNRLFALSITEDSINNLYNFVEIEGQFGKISSMMRCITKTKGIAGSLAKRGLHEIEAIITNFQTMGTKFEVFVSLGLFYNAQYSSGALFQILCKVKKRKKQGIEVLAAGSRYDTLISEFRKQTQLNQSVVGVSIALEKIIHAAQEERGLQYPCAVDVLVCTLGHKPLLKVQLSVARDLWSAGIKADILYDTMQSLEDIQDFCKDWCIGFIIIIKDVDGDKVRVGCFEKEKCTEKKIDRSEVVDYIQQKIVSAKSDSNASILSISSKSSTNSYQNNQEYSTSNSSIERQTNSEFSITFIPYEEKQKDKLLSNAKRRYESQIYAKLNLCSAYISQKVHIEVLAVDLPCSVLKTISAYLDMDGNEDEFKASIIAVIERHQRHRKYLSNVFDDKIFHKRFMEEKRCPMLIMLYGMKDDSYRILL